MSPGVKAVITVPELSIIVHGESENILMDNFVKFKIFLCLLMSWSGSDTRYLSI